MKFQVKILIELSVQLEKYQYKNVVRKTWLYFI